jgi:hypothetical protein
MIKADQANILVHDSRSKNFDKKTFRIESTPKSVHFLNQLNIHTSKLPTRPTDFQKESFDLL